MRIALGVTGGVAAYKAAELARRLQQDTFDVEVIMTRGAEEFLRPLTFAAITGDKVIPGMFGPSDSGPANVESAIEHIAVAQRIDLLLIAPATADILAKLAAGIADDFLTTLYLATKAPVVVAPAMNVNMWEHAATQENLARLRARGVRVVDPDEGYLACGMTGAGRLAGHEAILQAVREALSPRRDLAGETVLITAGPTCEDIDPVRYLTNRSSGRMGYALAEAALSRGAAVVLVSGPTSLAPPAGAGFVAVRSAGGMNRAVGQHLEPSTIIVMGGAAGRHPAGPWAPPKGERGAAPLPAGCPPWSRARTGGPPASCSSPRGVGASPPAASSGREMSRRTSRNRPTSPRRRSHSATADRASTVQPGMPSASLSRAKSSRSRRASAVRPW